MTGRMTEYYLWLLSVMGAANPRTIQLLKHFGGAREVWEEINSGRAGFLKPIELRNLKRTSIEKSAEILEYCKDCGYKVITIADPDYPVLLKNIYNPPAVLFADGDIKNLDGEICITVVGARKATPYSFAVTQRICEPLVKIGTTIISGLAVGVDKIAHMCATENGGRTIGVLACGIDLDYPSGSMEYRRRIADNGGAVITELLPGTRVDKAYFQERNRIMSGLSHGTLIIEASENSGCHITAGHAILQNRDLFCIPPANIFDARFTGVVGYLRDGAVPVFGYTDIVNQYSSKYGENYGKLSRALRETVFFELAEIKTGNLGLSGEHAPPEIIPQAPPPPEPGNLDEKSRRVADLLAQEARSIDYILTESGLSVGEAEDILLELELDGVIRSLPGARYEGVKHA